VILNNIKLNKELIVIDGKEFMNCSQNRREANFLAKERG